jgi:sugar (pentulose or hexulose) kinase
MPRYLTFDLGTTLYKVSLFDDSGNLLDVERATPPLMRTEPGRAEVDPNVFFRALVDAAAALRARSGNWSEVAAVSFATQANSFTFLDSGGVATMPLILWTDQRAASLAHELAQIASIPSLRETTGMPRLGPSLALAKMLWLRRHDPDRLAGAKRLCFISDYLTARLTGMTVSEAGVAGLSGAFDITSLHWRNDLLERLGVWPIAMPSVARAGTDLGPLAPAAARELGLPLTCRFVVGCLDQYAGAIGTGAIEPGSICETTGTVLAAVRCSDSIDLSLPADVYHGPAMEQGRYFQMSFSSTSANLLEWYRNSLVDKPSFEDLSRLAAEADDAVTIEPYRAGEAIENCFRQVRPAHSAGQVVRGIMRCVATSLKAQVSSLAPQTQAIVRSAGGAARSDTWLQMKADALGTTIEAVDCPEPTSLGAAMLAASAVTGRSLSDLANEWVRVRARFTPSN